ncbi:protein of unknown function [Xenorhabdus poinarii G6]|uniref:Uncharacterized protein n=1 Tax=Xenorhabdus poinarii G6 TaxID=1354304 RepID=A0A068R284_9GAMM|nr:protein of unknown function [Xenorhabdus poinarii G6]
MFEWAIKIPKFFILSCFKRELIFIDCLKCEQRGVLDGKLVGVIESHHLVAGTIIVIFF